MLIQPLRDLLQLAADLVLGEQIKYAGLDRAFLAHYRSGGGRSLWPQQPKIYPTLSGPACAKTPIPQMFQNASVCGRKLARAATVNLITVRSAFEVSSARDDRDYASVS